MPGLDRTLGGRRSIGMAEGGLQTSCGLRWDFEELLNLRQHQVSERFLAGGGQLAAVTQEDLHPAAKARPAQECLHPPALVHGKRQLRARLEKEQGIPSRHCLEQSKGSRVPPAGIFPSALEGGVHAGQRLGQKMQRIINEYAAQNGYVLVIDYRQMPVHYIHKSIDITQDLIRRYDAAYPVPGAAPAAAPAAAKKPAEPAAGTTPSP